MDNLLGPWPWYISGPIIGLFVPLLLLVGNKLFGVSSSFDGFCEVIPSKILRSKINFNSNKDGWKLYFVIGIIVGALISVSFLTSDKVRFLPLDYYTLGGIIKLFLGGLLVGFGTRYSGGCTSGHSITGISLLNRASIKATIAFFVGGLIYAYLIQYLF
jgi:uncharacterized membrane protein YedE/YeeE